MIKKDIVSYLQNRHGGMTRAEVEQHTETLLDLLVEATRAKEGLTVTHFGKFYRKHRVVREVVLPHGGRTLSGSGERTVFLPSPTLKTFVNASGDENDEK